MFMTIQFEWKNQLDLIEKELKKLEQGKKEGKEAYQQKIADNITKTWGSLHKEIQFSEYHLKHDTRENKRHQRIKQELAGTTYEKEFQEVMDEYNRFITEDQKNIDALKQIKQSLVLLKEKWEKLAEKKFELNQDLRNTNIGNLEGDLLFKDYRRLQKLTPPTLQEQLKVLSEKITKKKQQWEKQHHDLLDTISVRLDLIESQTAMIQAGQYTLEHSTIPWEREEIEKAENKIKETENFLKKMKALEEQIKTQYLEKSKKSEHVAEFHR